MRSRSALTALVRQARKQIPSPAPAAVLLAVARPVTLTPAAMQTPTLLATMDAAALLAVPSTALLHAKAAFRFRDDGPLFVVVGLPLPPLRRARQQISLAYKLLRVASGSPRLVCGPKAVLRPALRRPACVCRRRVSRTSGPTTIDVPLGLALP